MGRHKSSVSKNNVLHVRVNDVLLNRLDSFVVSDPLLDRSCVICDSIVFYLNTHAHGGTALGF